MRNHCINNLLNLKDVFVKKINFFDDKVYIYIESVPHSSSCPHCNSSSFAIKDYYSQTIKDVPIHFKQTFLILKKRRYICKSCHKTFFEAFDFLPKFHRSTNRLTAYIFQQLTTNKSMKQIAYESFVSINKVMRTVDLFSSDNSTLPEVLSIDEFKGNSGNFKYQVALIDSKNHKIIDILPCRYKHDLCSYFKKFSFKERSKVKYFVSDLWETYKDISMTYFPNAKIVADRFHFFRYINNALNDVRKDVQKNLPKSEQKHFFHSRKLFLSKMKDLKPEQLEKLNYILINYSENLRIIYREKEDLLDIIHSNDSDSKITRFNDWVKRNLSIDIPKLNEVAKTYSHWSYEIKNSLTVPYSNGVIEGFNNKIKNLKRISFGFRNFKRFRTRILLLD